MNAQLRGLVQVDHMLPDSLSRENMNLTFSQIWGNSYFKLDLEPRDVERLKLAAITNTYRLVLSLSN